MKIRVFCFLLVAGILLSAVCLLSSGTADASVPIPEKTTVSLSAAKAEEKVTRVLLLGCDRAASLTDTILLVTLREAEETVSVLQIPRDTFANYTERDYKKLNGAYNALGAEGLKRFLSRALCLPIDYYAAMDLDCVSSLVDAVGGVDLTVPQEMDHTDPETGRHIHLPAGKAHLGGAEAEWFVRFRSGYSNADLGRIGAQRTFLLAFAQKCAGLDAGTLFKLFLTVLPHLCTDLPLPEAVRLSGILARVGDHLHMETAEGSPVQGMSGAWYYSLNRAGVIGQINRLCAPDVPVSEADFDPDRVFDRTDLASFHKIYLAPAADGGSGSPQ